MRRRAAITDAELRRLLRTARKEGAASVDVKAGDWQATYRFGGDVDSGEKSKAKVARQVRTLL